MLSVSKLEMLLHGDVDLRSTNKVDVLVPFLNTSAHNLLYGGGCSSSRVCACVYEGVSALVSKLVTLLHCEVDFPSTNEAADRRFLLNTSAQNLLYGGRYVHMHAKVRLCGN